MKKTAIAYIPVIHAGHDRFFACQQPDRLAVLGASIISMFPRTERDIRALSPDRIAQAARLYGYAREVYVLEQDELFAFQDNASGYPHIVMPDEDISHWFADTYISGSTVEYDSTFLRWDMPASLSKRPVDPDKMVSIDALDHNLMACAMSEAQKSSDWWRQIGALAAKEGKELFRAHNRHMPSERSPFIEGDPRSNLDAGTNPGIYTSIHAEAGIIAQAARNVLEGTDVYSTTFPCPNCARLLAVVRIRRLYYSEGFSQLEGAEILKQAGVELIYVPFSKPEL